jgi:hypothetical protein
MPNVVREAVRDYNDARSFFTTQTSTEPNIAGRVKAASISKTSSGSSTATPG